MACCIRIPCMPYLNSPPDRVEPAMDAVTFLNFAPVMVVLESSR